MSTSIHPVVQHSVNEVKLLTQHIWRESGDHRGQVVTCVQGVVWLTHDNMPGDYVLQAGQAFVVEQRGLLLVQGLGEAVLQITDPTPSYSEARASLN
jgi:hypothetical protein